VGESTGELLKESLKDPAVQRGLSSISNAIENNGNVKGAVDGMVRDTGTEKGTTILNAVYKGMKQSGAPDKRVEGWNKARKMVANVRDVVEKIFDTFDINKATEISERLVKYWETNNKKYDLTPREQGQIYHKVDYGEFVPLSRRKKLNIDWSNHSEYRSDLRDIDHDKMNDVIQERLKNKLNPPEKKTLKFKETGVGTAVVDFDTKKSPAEADVITVFSAENFYNNSMGKSGRGKKMNIKDIASRVALTFEESQEYERKFENEVNKSKKLSGVDPNIAKYLVESGLDDGDPSDDKVSVSKKSVGASKLKPSQKTIRVAQVIGMALGMLKSGKIGGDLGALISSDNHILDGHHRWAASILAGGSSPKVGGYQAKLPGKDLIKVLNIVTKGEFGRQKGNSGSGNISDVNPKKVRSLLEEYTTKGIGGDFPVSAKDVQRVLEKKFGSVEKGIDEMSDNAKKVSKSVPSWASNRVDMPVITPQETPSTSTLLNQGKVNWNHPFVDENTEVPAGLVAKVANHFSKDILVTADEMEDYCSDCADKIRNGEFEMTWGELREVLK
jgi:hypothetical protein